MSTAPPSPRHVLVADDDRVTREYVAGLLRGNGYEVTTVDNGKKAIEGALKDGVSVVILDVVMDGLSGIDACRMIKSTSAQRGAFIPVLLLTARTDIDSRVEGLRIGADDYVCKPFDERELLGLVTSEDLLEAAYPPQSAQRAADVA